MGELFVDRRWSGPHGIGRYADEVIARLDIPHSHWTSGVAPASARDAINRDRWQLRSDDVLYSPGFSTGPARCIQILTIHDLIHLNETGRAGALKRAFYTHVIRPVVRRAGHVFTDSEASRQVVAEWLDDETQIHVTGCGASQEFTPDGPKAALCAPYFLYVGALKAHKNPRIVLDALKSLPDHRLVMVSDPIEGQRLAAEAGVSRQVTFRTGISDSELATLYRGAEALLFPSVMEGFGLPPLEAIRCRCPVIFNDACAAVKEVCGSVPGLPGDADADAWAITMLDPPRLTAHQRDWTEQYTWEATASVVSRVLPSLTGGEAAKE